MESSFRRGNKEASLQLARRPSMEKCIDKDKEIQKQVYHNLRILMDEINIQQFEQLLQKTNGNIRQHK